MVVSAQDRTVRTIQMQNSPAEVIVPDMIDIEADHKFQDVFNMLWLYVAFSSTREYTTASTYEIQ